MGKVSQKERAKVKALILKWNRYTKKEGVPREIVAVERAEHGFDCLNSIIFQMDNVIQDHRRGQFHKILFEPVMNWQNGFYKGF